MHVIAKPCAARTVAGPAVFDTREAAFVPPHGARGTDPRLDDPSWRTISTTNATAGTPSHHPEPPLPERAGGKEAGSREGEKTHVAQPPVDRVKPGFGLLAGGQPTLVMRVRVRNVHRASGRSERPA